MTEIDHTQNGHPEVASQYKILYHRDRVLAYLSGKSIFPLTLELDLTTKCTRTCDDCPSTRAKNYCVLKEGFIDKLLGCLAGQTRGLLLTGGEPTLAPLFCRILKLARQRGFTEIAVVTNGARLDRPDIIDALLAHASTIRLSMYDWDDKSCGGIRNMLGRVEALRTQIDKNGSPLCIGVSALTSTKRVGILGDLTKSVRDAGAHWIYFHPLCNNWASGKPLPVEQNRVETHIHRIRKKEGSGFGIFYLQERYSNLPLGFSRYHAAHFLLVIGADGKNYLGPEVKYQPDHVIAEPGLHWNENFLWDKSRLSRVDSVSNQTYPALRSRHRGVLYNHLLERLCMKSVDDPSELEATSKKIFLWPHIL